MSTLAEVSAIAAPLLTAVGPSLIQGIIQLVQAAHPVPPTADQAAKDEANAAKAAAALSTATTLATQLAPAVTASADPTAIANILAGALETMYQQMKAAGTLTAPTLVVTPAAPVVAKPLTTPVVITGVTITGQWQAPK